MILVTGAGGFIGSHSCRLLFQQGYDVVGIDRHFISPQPYHQLAGDIGSTDFLNKVMQTDTFDTIIHLAAVVLATYSSVKFCEVKSYYHAFLVS